MMDELNALAERCEKAEGPDRELDGLIYEAALPDIWKKEVARDAARFGEDLARGLAARAAREWTGSLDAAVAFVGKVLPDTYWMVARLGGNEFAGEVDKPGGRNVEACAAPALALMAAALRAKAAEEPNA